MATLNLGRIKPVFKGAYSGGTAYVIDDIVTHGDESFICIQAHGAGTQATSVTAYWTKLAAKGTDGTDVGVTITTQGDILYRDGSGLQRLAKGTASQVLKMNSGATAPEWGTDVGGKILQVIYAEDTTSRATTSTSYSTFSGTASISITPASTSNKILVQASYGYYKNASGYAKGTIQRGGTDLHTNEGLTKTYHPTDGGDSSYIQYLDSPNTTSATTYQLAIKSDQGANLSINHHSLLAMEISV